MSTCQLTLQVVELHDCFSANELISYEALGLCAKGKAGDFVERAILGREGPTVNPRGGLISKGHPLGATGIAKQPKLHIFALGILPGYNLRFTE